MSSSGAVKITINCNIDITESWNERTPEEQESTADPLGTQRESLQSYEMSSPAIVETGILCSSELNRDMSSLYKGSSDRQIEIDILDSANVKKFEKLVQSDQIKSPFKRRLSGGSSSEEADEKRPGTSVMDHNRDGGDSTNQQQGGQWKKSKMHENDHGNGRPRRESTSSGASSQNSSKQAEYETDEAVLARRQKQIDYGKNTLGYENYIQQVPRHARTKVHPKTPQKHLKYSRRAWDRLVQIWRKQLHCFDPKEEIADKV